MTPTLDQRALDHLARQCERDLNFLRHSPRERAEIIDAVIGGAVFFALAGALIWLPNLMALIERLAGA